MSGKVGLVNGNSPADFNSTRIEQQPNQQETTAKLSSGISVKSATPTDEKPLNLTGPAALSNKGDDKKGLGTKEFAPGQDKSGPGNSENAPGHNKDVPVPPPPPPEPTRQETEYQYYQQQTVKQEQRAIEVSTLRLQERRRVIDEQSQRNLDTRRVGNT